MSETILSNARVIAPDEVFIGTVVIRGDKIADVSRGATRASGAYDCEGDFLLPGLVELHTDNMERHLMPRPGVQWPRRAAVAAHDGEFVSVGVTTLFDAIRIGVMEADGIGDYAVSAIEAINQLRPLNLLKADHFIHLRCEICAPTVLQEFDALRDEPSIRLISLMDHTIGQRQFQREDKYREYYQGKKGMTDAELDAFIERSREFQTLYAEPHRKGLVERGARIREERGAFAVASHDDATEAHVAESRAAGATVAEFPTTLEAARASREAGMAVLMGAPNLLRGFSHSGNVSAMELAREGLIDVLSSDYAPAALMLATFKMADETDYSLPQAVACVTRNAACAVGLEDRGAIVPGLRADLARVYRAERLCVTRAAWHAGNRVA